MSLARQNLSKDAEDAINRQILTEFAAGYAYTSMAAWLARDTVALHGLAGFFREQAKEENEHAHKFIEYLTRRGGRIEWQAIPRPENEWHSALNCLESALKMEKDVNQSLLNLSKIAAQNDDPELEDFISHEFLHEQVDSIKQFADLITQLNLAGTTGLGLYLFDKQMHESK